MKVCKGGLLHAMQGWSCVLPRSNKQKYCVAAMTEMLLVLTLTLKPKLIAAMIPYFSSYIPPLTLKPKYFGKNDMAIRKGKETEKL